MSLRLKGGAARAVEELRAAVRAAATLKEVIKWGHLVYLANGPALPIRGMDARRNIAEVAHDYRPLPATEHDLTSRMRT